jgi:hypothetical protein
MCQVDLPATLAALTGGKQDATTSPDSQNHLPALLGESPHGRESLVEQAGGLALREGPWKFIPASNRPKRSGPTNTELGNDPAPQLYNLTTDPGERDNLAPQLPDRVAAMTKKLEAIKSQGTMARDGGP